MFLKLDKPSQSVNIVLELMHFFLTEFKKKGFCSIIARSVFCVGVYFLWRSSNDSIFNEVDFSKLNFLRSVEIEVKLVLKDKGIKENDTRSNRGIVTFWDLNFLYI